MSITESEYAAWLEKFRRDRAILSQFAAGHYTEGDAPMADVIAAIVRAWKLPAGWEQDAELALDLRYAQLEARAWRLFCKDTGLA